MIVLHLVPRGARFFDEHWTPRECLGLFPRMFTPLTGLMYSAVGTPRLISIPIFLAAVFCFSAVYMFRVVLQSPDEASHIVARYSHTSITFHSEEVVD